jgi:hypothetical protein
METFSKLTIASRWNRLRVIGNSTVARSTIAIPIIGYFIIFNSYVVDYLQLHTAFCQGSACGVSWRLYLLYFGACSFALGAALYGLYCPTIVKEYAGASEYFEAEKAYFTQPSNLRYLFKLIEQTKGEPAEDPRRLATEVVANQAIPQGRINELASVMGEHYVLQIYSHPHIRIGILLAYSIGTVFLVIPSVATFVQVAWRACKAAVGYLGLSS